MVPDKGIGGRALSDPPFGEEVVEALVTPLPGREFRLAGAAGVPVGRDHDGLDGGPAGSATASQHVAQRRFGLVHPDGAGFTFQRAQGQ
ncbi:hypothetical protein GCM10020254_80900 [Streptomyces goshikiensis]